MALQLMAIARSATYALAYQLQTVAGGAASSQGRSVVQRAAPSHRGRGLTSRPVTTGPPGAKGPRRSGALRTLCDTVERESNQSAEKKAESEVSLYQKSKSVKKVKRAKSLSKSKLKSKLGNPKPNLYGFKQYPTNLPTKLKATDTNASKCFENKEQSKAKLPFTAGKVSKKTSKRSPGISINKAARQDKAQEGTEVIKSVVGNKILDVKPHIPMTGPRIRGGTACLSAHQPASGIMAGGKHLNSHILTDKSPPKPAYLSPTMSGDVLQNKLNGSGSSASIRKKAKIIKTGKASKIALRETQDAAKDAMKKMDPKDAKTHVEKLTKDMGHWLGSVQDLLKQVENETAKSTLDSKSKAGAALPSFKVRGKFSELVRPGEYASERATNDFGKDAFQVRRQKLCQQGQSKPRGMLELRPSYVEDLHRGNVPISTRQKLGSRYDQSMGLYKKIRPSKSPKTAIKPLSAMLSIKDEDLQAFDWEARKPIKFSPPKKSELVNANNGFVLIDEKASKPIDTTIEKGFILVDEDRNKADKSLSKQPAEMEKTSPPKGFVLVPDTAIENVKIKGPEESGFILINDKAPTAGVAAKRTEDPLSEKDNISLSMDRKNLEKKKPQKLPRYAPDAEKQPKIWDTQLPSPKDLTARMSHVISKGGDTDRSSANKDMATAGRPNEGKKEKSKDSPFNMEDYPDWVFADAPAEFLKPEQIVSSKPRSGQHVSDKLSPKAAVDLAQNHQESLSRDNGKEDVRDLLTEPRKPDVSDVEMWSKMLTDKMNKIKERKLSTQQGGPQHSNTPVVPSVAKKSGSALPKCDAVEKSSELLRTSPAKPAESPKLYSMQSRKKTPNSQKDSNLIEDLRTQWRESFLKMKEESLRNAKLVKQLAMANTSLKQPEAPIKKIKLKRYQDLASPHDRSFQEWFNDTASKRSRKRSISKKESTPAKSVEKTIQGDGSLAKPIGEKSITPLPVDHIQKEMNRFTSDRDNKYLKIFMQGKPEPQNSPKRPANALPTSVPKEGLSFKQSQIDHLIKELKQRRKVESMIHKAREQRQVPREASAVGTREKPLGPTGTGDVAQSFNQLPGALHRDIRETFLRSDFRDRSANNQAVNSPGKHSLRQEKLLPISGKSQKATEIIDSAESEAQQLVANINRMMVQLDPARPEDQEAPSPRGRLKGRKSPLDGLITMTLTPLPAANNVIRSANDISHAHMEPLVAQKEPDCADSQGYLPSSPEPKAGAMRDFGSISDALGIKPKNQTEPRESMTHLHGSPGVSGLHKFLDGPGSSPSAARREATLRHMRSDLITAYRRHIRKHEEILQRYKGKLRAVEKRHRCPEQGK